MHLFANAKILCYFFAMFPFNAIGRNIHRLRTSCQMMVKEFSQTTKHFPERDQDTHFMQLALRHAQHSFREKEVPVGAVIVDDKGLVVATARNRVESLQDCTMHAEMDCIRKASIQIGNWRLMNCTIYSTLEPCPMCMGAIQAARIKRLVYGARDPRIGACGSYVDLGKDNPFNQVIVRSGLKELESSTLLKRFFRMRRLETTKSDDLNLGDYDNQQ